MAGVWCGWSLATPGGGSCVLIPATPGWFLLPVVVGVPRGSWLRVPGAVPCHSWLAFAVVGGGCSSPLLAEGPGCGSPPLLAGVRWRRWCVVCGVWCVVCGVWCAVVVCWWGCGWCVVWLVPRHSLRRFLCATPHHSFAAGGGGRYSLVCVVACVWCAGGLRFGVPASCHSWPCAVGVKSYSRNDPAALYRADKAAWQQMRLQEADLDVVAYQEIRLKAKDNVVCAQMYDKEGREYQREWAQGVPLLVRRGLSVVQDKKVGGRDEGRCMMWRQRWTGGHHQLPCPAWEEGQRVCGAAED